MTWHPNDKRWRARYYDADGKLVYVGNFVDEAAAALAYNAAIREAGLKRRVNPEGRSDRSLVLVCNLCILSLTSAPARRLSLMYF